MALVWQASAFASPSLSMLKQSCAMAEPPSTTQLRLMRNERASTSFAVSCDTSYLITFRVTRPSDGSSVLVSTSNPSQVLPVQYQISSSDGAADSRRYLNHTVIEHAGKRTYVVSVLMMTIVSSMNPAGEYTGNMAIDLMF